MKRTATVAVLGVVGIVAMTSATRELFVASDAADARVGDAGAQISGKGVRTHPLIAANSPTAASARGPVPIPAPITTLGAATPADLPPTLELVTIIAPAGGRTPASKPIARAEAIAAVIGSPQFQETVSPLARLYFAAFGRFPDYTGLNYYTGAREDGALLAQIANEFVGGREFEMRYGKLDNAEFVERIFVNVLGHASQPDVRAYWIDELDAGRMTRGAVLVDLSESGAFRDRTANQVFVSTAYTEILRRTPDATGYDRYVSLLNAGYPQRTVIDGLLGGR